MSRKQDRPMIGWREWVVLPELTPESIKAKIDTGAVTSSLHALDMELVTGEVGTVARFGLQPWDSVCCWGGGP